LSGPSRIESELGNLTNGQTNPEGPARLTRRLMDLVRIVIFETEYSMLSRQSTLRYRLAGGDPSLASGILKRIERYAVPANAEPAQISAKPVSG